MRNKVVFGMAFSREKVESLLVSARRCCCVCRRFCGRNIEIHHIVPSSEGGSDEEENGIPICFDCHADVHSAGSPRGRRFTHGELRRLRDEWFASSKEISAPELQRIRAEIIEYLDSLNIPTIHDTLLNITETLEVLLKAKENESRQQEFADRYKVRLIADPRYYARLGALELEYKNYTEAANLLTQSLEIDEQQAAVNFNLFKALLELHRFDEALEAYTRAVSLDENLRILPTGYQISGVLGQGTFSTVYKAEVNGKLLAVKVLRGEYMRDYSVATSFYEEADIIRELAHGSFACVYERATFNGRYYLALEYVEAVSLTQLIDSGKLAPREVLGIAAKLASGVEYLHSHGVVHRDIKPQNILVIGREKDVKIIDFGVARWTDTLTSTAFGVGTPIYAPPEIFDRAFRGVSFPADIYSLGVTFFKAMTGELPRVNVEVPTPSGYSSSVWELVASMLSADPKQRPTAGDVHRALERAYADFNE